MITRRKKAFLGRVALMAALSMALSAACKTKESGETAAAPSVPVSVASAVPSAAPKAPPKPAPRPPYNVLLIMIDSLRADMPWAGYPRPIAPWMTEFTKRATLYPRGYSFSSYTAKSVAPALVGEYPSAMKRDGRFFTIWFKDNVFIGERLEPLGHRTLAGHAHGYFMPALGLDQGFADYRLLPGTFLDLTGVHDVTSEKLNALAKEMLSDPKNTPTADKKFFAYFHFLDPHYVYYEHDDHPKFGKDRRDLYDNEVHYTDRWVGDLVDWALAQPWGKDTAVILTADHGEGFGEHGQYRHAYEIWEALVRVPLIIYVPGAPPRRIELPRGHIDLAPTIAELMGLAGVEWRGKSLVPEIFGAEPTPRPVLIDLPRSDLMDRRRAVIDGQYKLISFGDDARFALYDVVADPKEETKLTDAALMERMRELYRKAWDEIPNVPIIGGTELKGAPRGRGW